LNQEKDEREHFWEKLRRKVNGFGKLVIKEENLMGKRMMVWFGIKMVLRE